MRTEGQIKHKLKQVKYRHLKRRIRTSLSRRPCNCIHNETVEVPGGPGFSVCMKSERKGLLCDEHYGGDLVASDCPFFTTRTTVDEIKDEFNTWLLTASHAEIAQEMPDLIALLWVLGEDVPGETSDQNGPEPLSDEPPSPPPTEGISEPLVLHTTWWGRLRKKLCGWFHPMKRVSA